MNIIEKFMTRNDCYNTNQKITPKGIMVHSTATPGIMALDWFDRWNKSYAKGEINRQACVHAFLDDKVVMQYLPWNHRGWHAGGTANNTHIGFEICEPKDLNNKDYFKAIWDNSIELCVKLCKEYNLTEKDIICHSEGYKKGVASNHADVMHWFPLHEKNMDLFRQEVKERLEKKELTLAVEPKRYKNIDEMPIWLQDFVKKLVDKGIIKGNTSGDLDFTEDMLRCLIITDRMINQGK